MSEEDAIMEAIEDDEEEEEGEEEWPVPEYQRDFLTQIHADRLSALVRHIQDRAMFGYLPDDVSQKIVQTLMDGQSTQFPNFSSPLPPSPLWLLSF